MEKCSHIHTSLLLFYSSFLFGLRVLLFSSITVFNMNSSRARRPISAAPLSRTLRQQSPQEEGDCSFTSSTSNFSNL